jgi:hypothetical protein
MEVHVTADLEYHLYSTHVVLQTVTNGTNGQYRLFIHGHKRALSDTYLPIGKKTFQQNNFHSKSTRPVSVQ